ncbi:MAG: hypothetical protein WC291_08160 [Thermodesulfovibrionales bacterium]|jgi:hypothetical protein
MPRADPLSLIFTKQDRKRQDSKMKDLTLQFPERGESGAEAEGKEVTPPLLPIMPYKPATPCSDIFYAKAFPEGPACINTARRCIIVMISKENFESNDLLRFSAWRYERQK